jgi:hypothetical protein
VAKGDKKANLLKDPLAGMAEANTEQPSFGPESKTTSPSSAPDRACSRIRPVLRKESAQIAEGQQTQRENVVIGRREIAMQNPIPPSKHLHSVGYVRWNVSALLKPSCFLHQTSKPVRLFSSPSDHAVDDRLNGREQDSQGREVLSIIIQLRALNDRLLVGIVREFRLTNQGEELAELRLGISVGASQLFSFDEPRRRMLRSATRVADVWRTSATPTCLTDGCILGDYPSSINVGDEDGVLGGRVTCPARSAGVA